MVINECMNTWSTWDVEHLNAVMKAPELAEVRIGVYDVKSKLYRDRLLWKSVARLGMRSVSGDYF